MLKINNYIFNEYVSDLQRHKSLVKKLHSKDLQSILTPDLKSPPPGSQFNGRVAAFGPGDPDSNPGED